MVLSGHAAAGHVSSPANPLVGVLADESAFCGILKEEPAGSGDCRKGQLGDLVTAPWVGGSLDKLVGRSQVEGKE